MKVYAVYRQSLNTGRWFLRSAFHPLEEARRITRIALAEGEAWPQAIVQHRFRNSWPAEMLQQLPRKGN